MDENRLKKVVQSALDISFSGLTITEFKALETSQLTEDFEWEPFSYTLFITLSRGKTLNENYIQSGNIINFLESLIGFECCVDFS